MGGPPIRAKRGRRVNFTTRPSRATNTVFAALDGAHTRLSLSLKTYAPEAGHGEDEGSIRRVQADLKVMATPFMQ